MSQHNDVKEIKTVLTQLHHAYQQLLQNNIKDQREFAEGLIAPQIRKLELLIK